MVARVGRILPPDATRRRLDSISPRAAAAAAAAAAAVAEGGRSFRDASARPTSLVTCSFVRRARSLSHCVFLPRGLFPSHLNALQGRGIISPLTQWPSTGRHKGHKGHKEVTHPARPRGVVFARSLSLAMDVLCAVGPHATRLTSPHASPRHTPLSRAARPFSSRVSHQHHFTSVSHDAISFSIGLRPTRGTTAPRRCNLAVSRAATPSASPHGVGCPGHTPRTSPPIVARAPPTPSSSTSSTTGRA